MRDTFDSIFRIIVVGLGITFALTCEPLPAQPVQVDDAIGQIPELTVPGESLNADPISDESGQSNAESVVENDFEWLQGFRSGYDGGFVIANPAPNLAQTGQLARLESAFISAATFWNRWAGSLGLRYQYPDQFNGQNNPNNEFDESEQRQ